MDYLFFNLICIFVIGIVSWCFSSGKKVNKNKKTFLRGDKKGMTKALLINASKKGDLKTIKEFIKNGININQTILTIGDDFSEMYKEMSSDPTATEKVMTPLELASKYGHLEIVRELLKAGAEDGYLGNSLVSASMHGHLEIVRELLKAGMDPNGRIGSLYSFNPLTSASMHGHLEIVRELLKAGANVNCTDYTGRTELMWAQEEDYQEIVRELLKAGANETYSEL